LGHVKKRKKKDGVEENAKDNSAKTTSNLTSGNKGRRGAIRDPREPSGINQKRMHFPEPKQQTGGGNERAGKKGSEPG